MALETAAGIPGAAAAPAVAPVIALGAVLWPNATARDDTLFAHGRPADGTPAAAPSDKAGAIMLPMAMPVTPPAALPTVAAAAATAAQANNCRLIFVPETPGTTPSQIKGWRYQQQGPNGGLLDTRTGMPIVPALEYANPNPDGSTFVKFDNFEPDPSGRTRVIDSKTSMVTKASTTRPGEYWTSPRVLNGLRPESAALKQNPGCIGVLHVPDEREAAFARAVIKEWGFSNMTVKVRSWQ